MTTSQAMYVLFQQKVGATGKMADYREKLNAECKTIGEK